MSALNIINRLINAGMSVNGALGMWGNIDKESEGGRANNAENGRSKYDDETYTRYVDEGRLDFVYDTIGYGISQWTFWSRKQALLDFARARGVSIGDENMQVDFLIKEMQASYPTVWEACCNPNISIYDATAIVCKQYEKPAKDTTDERYQLALNAYNKYKNQLGGDKMLFNRERIVAQAKSWLGRKEADGSFREIIDVYNSCRPLPRGYAVSYNDAWCAAFVSACAVAVGYTDIIPRECSCPEMITLFQNMGRWIEDDGYAPRAGDIIFYDWQDTGVGNNIGVADHVGIVESCDGSTITVIEGNISDSVGRRNISVNGRYIRGYGIPNYDAEILPPKEAETKPDVSVVLNKTADPTPILLRRGCIGYQVKAMQVLLIGRGYLVGRLADDGEFGQDTERALIRFQTDNCIEVDGICGSQTWNYLLKNK